jgi:hypothetical protein
MPSVELTVKQVIELVRQLPWQDKIAVLSALEAEHRAWMDTILEQGEQRLRQVCAERGLDWDRMSENEREVFVDDWLHEDK